jgi:isopentenyl phosphate kinase
MQEDLIVLKFGGSLITEKTSKVPKAKMDAINQIADKLKNSTKRIIIVHGAGSYGHPIAKKHGLSKGLNNSSEQKEAIDETRKQVHELNQLLCSKLENVGVQTKTIIPSETMKTKGPDKIKKFPVDEFNSVLKANKIPVTYGDVTDDLSQGVTILSGDVIMMELARIYNPQLTIFVMDYPGVMEGDPKDLKAKVIPLVNSDIIESIRKYYRKGDGTDVTGGLVGKLDCAAEIAKHSECWITNLENLDDCLEGKPNGSRVVP